MHLGARAAQSETAGTVVKFITENGSAVNPGQVRSGLLTRLLCGALGCCAPDCVTLPCYQA